MSNNTGKRVIKPTKRNKPIKITKKKNFKYTNNTPRNIKEERQIIINCCNSAGECYRFLGVTQDSTPEEIEQSFEQLVEEIRNEVGDNITPDQQEELQYRYDCCVSAYTILSDPRLKSLYDKEFLEEMIENESEENSYNQMNDIIVSLLIKFLSAPFEIVEKKLAQPGLHSVKSIIKSLYNQGGYRSFFKGFAFIRLYPLFHSIIDYSIEKVLESKLLFGNPSSSNKNNNNNNKLKSIIHLVAFNITSFPFVFIGDCIQLAPLAMPIVQIIKSVILRQGSDGGKLQFKNLFYSVASSMFLFVTSKLISSSIRSIENIIIEKQRKNPGSSTLKYCKLIYCNPISQGILTAILVSPIHVIRLQYPYQFIQSYLTNTPIPKPINPISMAIQIYNQQGFKKFFNGLTTIILPQYTLLSLASKIYPNEKSIYTI